MPKPRVYLETSFIGYLTGRLSRDLITAAHQKLTRDWWDDQRRHFELFVSEPVIEEISAGNAAEVARRMRFLVDVGRVPLPIGAEQVARALIDQGLVPRKAAVDALHVAIAAVAEMNYLLTWNCKHIANATTRERIGTVIRTLGYQPAVLCTPEELAGV